MKKLSLHDYDAFELGSEGVKVSAQLMGSNAELLELAAKKDWRAKARRRGGFELRMSGERGDWERRWQLFIIGSESGVRMHAKREEWVRGVSGGAELEDARRFRRREFVSRERPGGVRRRGRNFNRTRENEKTRV